MPQKRQEKVKEKLAGWLDVAARIDREIRSPLTTRQDASPKDREKDKDTDKDSPRDSPK